MQTISYAFHAYLYFVNMAAFLMFFADKRASLRGDWRTSEAALLAVALAGGSLGAKLGQRLLRHKTRKEPFRTRLNRVVALHLFTLVPLFAISLL